MESEFTGRPRPDRSSRRTFLRGVTALSATTGAALAAGTTGATEARDSPPVRRSVASLRRHDPDDVLPTFREAIRRLRELPASDPRNLDDLVAIHGTRQRFEDCEHGNWAFLPWHRAYLHCFEELCRDVTGNEAFAVPYWNWVERPRLPGVFRGADGDPLYDPTRTAVSTADSTIVGPESIEPILEDPNFYRVIGGWAGPRGADGSTIDAGEADPTSAEASPTNTEASSPNAEANPADAEANATTADGGAMRFGSGALEQPAHDYVHVRIGGNMATGASPADPCFWTHHAMLDWLWWEWNARGHPNADDPAWLQTSFDGQFVGRDGEPVEDFSIADALSLPGTAYTFDRRASFEDAARAAPGAPRASPDNRAGDGQDGGASDGQGGGAGGDRGTGRGSGGARSPADRPAPPVGERDGVTDEAVRAAQTATADVDLERLAATTVLSSVDLAADDSTAVATADAVVGAGEPAETFEAVLAGETPGRLWLAGREIDLPARGSFVTSVFVDGAAAGPASATGESELVGSWLFFRAPPMHPPQNYFVDVTAPLRRRYEAGALPADEPIEFRLVAEPPTGQRAHGALVTADRLDLEVRQSVIDGAVVEHGE